MKMSVLIVVAAALVVLSTATLIAAPARNLSDVQNGQMIAPIAQWFQYPTGAVVVNNKEFYDNLIGQPIPSIPWGGALSTQAIGGKVKQITYDPVGSGGIIAFKVEAWVTNDLYTYKGDLYRTNGVNDHGQFAPDIVTQVIENMKEVRLSASFSDKQPYGDLPKVSPFGPEANIFAKNPDAFAWYCYYSATPPPQANETGGYWVPTWDFTGALASDPARATPAVIEPGNTHYRDLEFCCYIAVMPGSDDYNVITESYYYQKDIFLNRTPSLKISNYPDNLALDTGDAFPAKPLGGSDVSVFYNPEPLPEPGELIFGEYRDIPSHFWYPNPDPYNEMYSLMVQCGPTEGVSWKSITLKAQSPGAGNDQTDILSVDVWIDYNHNANVDPTDGHLGSGVYPLDEGTLTINFPTPHAVNVGTTWEILISYKMSNACPVGAQYRFSIIGAYGEGIITGVPVSITGLPLDSNTKTVAIKPIKIGEAKKLPIGERFFLEGKVVTANLVSRMYLLYIEEEDRSAGIAVYLPTLPAPMSEGDRVSVLGYCTLLDGVEMAVVPIEGAVLGAGTKLKPVGMNNKTTGGGHFGGQPAVLDNAVTGVYSEGLNNVGMLVRTWGRYTGGGVTMPGATFWMDDGSNLVDGFYFSSQKPAIGIAVLLLPSGIWPSDYNGVTGILRCIKNPYGKPVRLLVPRYPDDITFYPEP